MLTRSNVDAMRALEDLTPGGSEFHDDVSACVAFILKAREGCHQAKKDRVRLRRDLLAAREDAERLAALIQVNHDCKCDSPWCISARAALAAHKALGGGDA